MKFWEIRSLLNRRGIRSTDLPDAEGWHRYRRWWDQFADLDRAVLDHDVPNDLALAALILLKEPYFLEGHILRRRPLGDAAEQISAVEIAQRFGGSIIEEVEEYGSADVLQQDKAPG